MDQDFSSDRDSDEEYSDTELDTSEDSDLEFDELLDENSNSDLDEEEIINPNDMVMKVTNNKIKELEDRIASLRKVQSDIG